LTPGATIPEAEWRLHFREFLKRRPGISCVLKSVREHRFDPWGRVEAEMKKFNPHLSNTG
jgi:hypothetical protein